jgi:uncharacterized protein YbjT (DUF2867 family)
MRVLVRRPQAMEIPNGTLVDMVAGDVQDNASLVRALRDIEIAYYLVNSRGSSDSLEADRRAAWNFVQAAKAANVRRIIYLSGGTLDTSPASPARTGREVGDLLRESGIQVIEFRASMIIGAGSMPFELVRALGERVPFQIATRWVMQRVRPIALRDAISYLAAARNIDLRGNSIFEIGGLKQVSYGDIVREYSRQRGLRRSIIRVPGIAPERGRRGISGPAQTDVVTNPAEDGETSMMVRDPVTRRVFSVSPVSMSQAIADALLDEDRDFATPNWFRRLSGTSPRPFESGVSVGNRIVLSNSISVEASPAVAFAPIRRIGGKNGWYYGRALCEIRNLIDRTFGGKGLARLRRDGEDLAVGDRIDFWRVERFIRNRKLTLVADMKMRGRAWIDFEVEPVSDGSTIRQSFIFDPKGLAGRFYWYLARPLQRLILGQMLRGIAAAAEDTHRASGRSINRLQGQLGA